LGRIKARCLILPLRTDQFFRSEDSEEDVQHLKNGELRCIESVYRHLAGGRDGTKEDTELMPYVCPGDLPPFIPLAQCSQ
jgi:homoserine acetyltransferase